MNACTYVSGAGRAHQWAFKPKSTGARLYLLGNQVLAALILLLVSPVMLAIGWRIRAVDGGPALYGHYRVGLDGRLFKCLKFRSMHVDADRLFEELLRKDARARLEWQRHQKLSHDPRVTGIGQLLRRTSLDELPQLINVVRAEMVLVGPRPITRHELSRYGESRWHYLAVHPGITGLWQVSGRSDMSYDERVTIDCHYVERRTAWMDLSILLRTVLVVISGHGAR